ncbi:DUF3817 domain-containing protein [Shimazuella soli]|uniref:DUF3817 domain-containing protein n=1 Tax=Shimazuella soli TaxID=1892854 RepID=UPI0030B85ED5
MLQTPLARFRVIALAEGISYLALLFIAYLLTLAHVYFHDKWKFSQGVIAVLASIIPFATFFLDRKLSRDYPSKLKLESKVYLFVWFLAYLIVLSAVYKLVTFYTHLR